MNKYIPACPKPQVQLWVPEKLEFLFFSLCLMHLQLLNLVFSDLIVKLVTFQVLGVCPIIVVGRMDGQSGSWSFQEMKKLPWIYHDRSCGLCAFPGKLRESSVYTTGLESFILIPFAIYCSTTQNSPSSWLQNSTPPYFFLRLLFLQVFQCQDMGHSMPSLLPMAFYLWWPWSLTPTQSTWDTCGTLRWNVPASPISIWLESWFMFQK